MTTTWHDAVQLGIRGQGVPAGGAAIRPFSRLPIAAEAAVPAAVWGNAETSAGLWIDFRSDATAIEARVQVRLPLQPEHHYVRYLDLYCRDGDGRWRWAGVNRYGLIPSGQTPVIDGLERAWREWRLYLPLVFGLERLEIGIPADCRIEPVARDARLPVIVYGTSIVHGCAHVSRPGMAWPAIVGRRLDRPIVNLGFSGSACMELAVAELIAAMPAAAIVIDPLANMSGELVAERAEAFVRCLLRSQPRTPLLLVDDRAHACSWLRPGYRAGQEPKQRAFAELAARLAAAGHPVSHRSGGDLLGSDGDGTVDGSHPNDLGAVRYADALTPAIAALLGS